MRSAGNWWMPDDKPQLCGTSADAGYSLGYAFLLFYLYLIKYKNI